ncbi:hypothetical protein [Tepidibacillus marianensis]|uniref:hypothetical protein n=1 Tax=Tepidibacillus marianensis TaxID=3131995 RepID=UPI0030D4860B
MEKQLLATKKAETGTTQFAEEEIPLSYDNLILPNRNLVKSIYVFNQKTTFDSTTKNSNIKLAQELLAQMSKDQFQSPYLKETQIHSQNSIKMLIRFLQSNNDLSLLNQSYQEFLQCQAEWYRNIWLWDQSQTNSTNLLKRDVTLNWTEWTQANLHERNYIIATTLVQKQIHTFSQPEDITVHVDAYQKSNSNSNITLDELIHLFITSEAVQPRDFIKYKDQYVPVRMPQVAIYQ